MPLCHCALCESADVFAVSDKKIERSLNRRESAPAIARKEEKEREEKRDERRVSTRDKSEKKETKDTKDKRATLKKKESRDSKKVEITAPTKTREGSVRLDESNVNNQLSELVDQLGIPEKDLLNMSLATKWKLIQQYQSENRTGELTPEKAVHLLKSERSTVRHFRSFRYFAFCLRRSRRHAASVLSCVQCSSNDSAGCMGE